MIVYDLPELYKALALAHMKSREDEAWKIAHERLLRLVEALEDSNDKLALFNVSLGYYLKSHVQALLSFVEAGDAASLMAVYEVLEGKLRVLRSQARIAHFYIVSLRLLVAALTLVSAMIIAYISLTLGAIVQLTLALIAAGVSIAGLLLVTHRDGHIAPLISIIIQAVTLATNIEILRITSVASLLVASATIALLGYIQINIERNIKTTIKKTF